jgi:predicted lipase
MDRKLCSLSQAVYHPEKSKSKGTLVTNESGGVCVVHSDPKNESVVIVFRGTVLVHEELEDIDFRLVPFDTDYPKVHIHHGFLTHFLGFEKILTPLIEKHLSQGVKTFIFTGHSLGASTSSLAAVWYANLLQTKGQKDLRFINVTFGSPKVGNKAFKKLTSKVVHEVRRYVVSSDPVPTLPSWSSFTHNSKPIVLDSKPCFEKWFQACGTQKLTWKGHHIKKYMSLIEKREK